MSKRSIIILSTLVAIMALAAVAMVYVLYNGMPELGFLCDDSDSTAVQAPVEHGIKPAVEPVRIPLEPTPEEMDEADSVAVAEGLDGPFEVRNSATGRTNLLALSEGSLTLTEIPGGALLWSRPFSGHLAGMAATIDFYANGRLQFLFISGSTLWLYDRLGRVVEGFPVELRKSVLRGPAVYDFNNQKKYNIMVLNKDNTIDMYNLKGEIPSGWKGIAPKEKIKGLPGYTEKGSKSYWIVHTENSTLVYGFYAGEPLQTLTGDVPTDKIIL